ncbi:CD180 antigen [Pleurodeles waltl]|uniref:CD180 antigen n=1 Tax=Pleurodeles waltl TaxID=8319 RepID=UPI003709C12C
MALRKCFLALALTAHLSCEGSSLQVSAAGKTCVKVIGDESYTCCDLGLNEIPESLPSSLKILDFSFNAIFAIYQSTFSRLRSLRHLDLTRCLISWLYEGAFASNPDLDTLVLIGNPLMYVADTAFDGPVSLKHLFLTQTGLSDLTYIPMQNLNSLETLHLGNNYLTSIKLPTGFLGKRLKYLDFQLNNIHSISATDVENLKQATNISLILKGNYIKYIEPRSFNLSVFYTLDFAGCASSVEISVILVGLMGVNAHILRIGTFQDVADNIGIAPHMLQAICNITTAEVNLQNMHFSGLSSSTFQCLTKIQKLDLTNTGLSDLPSGISNNSLLTDLILNENSFEHACDIKLASFPFLTRLSLKRTEALQLGSGCFKDLAKLQYLDLSISGIGSSDCCSAQFQGLVSLKYLNLSYNDMHTVQDLAFQDNIHLELLDFTHTHLKVNASQKPFRNLQHLRMLNLSSSHADTSNRDLLTGLKSLVILNLKGNAFSSGIIHSSNLLQQVPNLEVLILSECELIAIDNEAFHNLTKLKYVLLNRNKLTMFSTNAFYDLRQIVLNFAENHIKIIPQKMVNGISGLSIIDLSYNPLDCSCDNIEFLTWLHKNMDKMENLEETSCSTPNALAGTRLDMVMLSCGVPVVVIVLIVVLLPLLIAASAFMILYCLKRRYHSI